MPEQQTTRKYLLPGEIVLDWIPKHWPLTPIGINKNPYIPNWQNNPRTVEEIQDQILEGHCKAVGLLSGPCFNQGYGLVWVDVDGPSAQAKVSELSHLSWEDSLPPTLAICSGREGRERRLYRVKQDDFKIFTRNKYSWTTNVKNERLEVLWSNHQGILMGLHPQTSGYYTPVGFGFEWVDQLPTIPQWLLDALITKNARMGPPVKQVTRVNGPGFAFSLVKDVERDIQTAIEAMWSLPEELADDYETWIIVGQALHSVDEGLLDHWDGWSQQSMKYQAGVCERKWQSFNSENGIGLGTLIEISKQYSNTMHQRLAIEAASAPSDHDLDVIEALRQQEESLVIQAIGQQMVAHDQQLTHIGQVLDGMSQVIEETTGQSFAPQAETAWEEFIQAGGFPYGEDNSSEPVPSRTQTRKQQIKGNPPADQIRNAVLQMIGGRTVCDATEEAFYQYEYHSPGVWSKLSHYEAHAMIQNTLDKINLPRGYGSGTVQTIIDLVAPQLAFNDWNVNPELLNFTNGMLDIKTMELMPHDKEAYMVTQLPFEYDPSAECPKTQQWLAFTQFHNQELVQVLRAWLRAVLIGRHELQMFLELVGAAGAGKAQPLNAPVLTPTGWIRMKDVVPGTKVCTPDGKTASVLGVFPQGEREVYRIRFNDGSQAESCGEHLWKVEIDGAEVVLPLEAIIAYRNKHHLADDYENCHQVYVPLTAPVKLKKAPINRDPYQAGIDCIQFHYKQSGSRITTVKGGRVYGPYECYFQNSLSVRQGFLQGMMDCYGELGNHGFYQLSVDCSELAQALQILIRSLGGLVHLETASIQDVNAEMKIYERPVYHLKFQMPAKVCPFRSHKKKLKRWKQLKLPYYATHKFIVAIELIGTQPVQCIYVDHPDHLYVTSDYTVTHNTSFANLCIALVGFQNTFSTRLNLLESNRFEVSGAYNKKLIIINDADRYGGSVEVLKAMTGGDQLRMEIKYQKQTGTGFVYRGLIMTTANESIQTTDLTGGLFRRRLTLPFSRSRHFSQGDAPDQTLIAFDRNGAPYGHLADELPGIVNWVLKMSEEDMIKYTKYAVDHVAALRDVKADQLSENNNIMDWMNDRIVYDPMICTIVGERKETDGEYYYQHADKWLYASYCDHCRKGNVREVGRRRFIALLEDVCRHQLKLKVKILKGVRGRVMFKGLAIRRNNDATYDHYPSAIEFAFNKEAYEAIYGSARNIDEQIRDESYISSRMQPSLHGGGIPDLPF